MSMFNRAAALAFAVGLLTVPAQASDSSDRAEFRADLPAFTVTAPALAPSDATVNLAIAEAAGDDVAARQWQALAEATR